MGPPRVVTSVHDGYSVRAVHGEFQPTAATDTAVPLRTVPEHQDFIVQVFRDPNTRAYRTITAFCCPLFPLIVIVFISWLIYLIRPLIFNDLSLLIFVCDIQLYYGNIIYCVCGPGSSVGVGTEVRAGRSGIEPRWGRDFPPIQTGPGAHPASCRMCSGSFLGCFPPRFAVSVNDKLWEN